MSQCLRCSKPCMAASVFCDECRSLLKNQLQQEPGPSDSSTTGEQIEVQSVQGDPLERITSPMPVTRPSAVSEAITLPLVGIQTTPDQAITRLSEAAQRIAEEEPGYRRLPRASRLAPIRDISAEIQRESTPLPQVKSITDAAQYAEQQTRRLKNGVVQEDRQSSPELPDLWPWLDTDSEEKENDVWANGTDPLQARQFPNSSEAARIEEEDIRRAVAEGITTAPYPSVRRSNVRSSPWRLAFSCLVLMAIVALAVDGVLISVAFNHPHRPVDTQNGPPTLTLSSNVASMGQSIDLRLSHFTPSSKVYLTHDIEVGIQTSTNSSVVQVGANGSAGASVVVGNDWGPGFHLIVAEDIATRYTASATLQIINAGPTRPPHLLIGSTTLDLGTDVQGANTIQPLSLSNTGNGTITWSVNSNQPWLQLSPTQGIFSAEQTVAVAVQRTNLKPGDYTGIITVFSNVGAPLRIQVQMTVRPLPPNAGAVMSLMPAVLSFTANDGAANPAAQTLTLSNPGSKPLSWSLNNSPLAIAPYQASLLNALGASASWLNTDKTSGTIDPGGTDQIQVIVNSQSLLPGSYAGSLVFTAPQGAIDSPQTVSVSLTIQPHCDLLTSSGSLSFTAVSGQSNPSNQTLALNASPGCAGTTISWQAVSSDNWLIASPSTGQISGTTSGVTTIGVNAGGLLPNRYFGQVSILTGQSTQTVIVQLTVLPPPPPQAPTIAVSPGSLYFSFTAGQPNPPAQVITISNSGGSTLHWVDSLNTFTSSWLTVDKSGDKIPAPPPGQPAQTEQISVTIAASVLKPSTQPYVGKIMFSGTDDNGVPVAGSPSVMIYVNVAPACTVTPPSSSVVNFTAVQGSPNPSPTSVTFSASGSCAWPLTWNAAASSGSSWLTLTPSGKINGSSATPGAPATITLSVDATSQTPSATPYTSTVTITTVDQNGVAVGTPQTFTVNLTVEQPCTLAALPTSLTFTASQGQAATAPQSLAINAQGSSCGSQIAWSATGDSASSSWLNLSTTSGAGSSGTIDVKAIPGTLTPGTYSGTITVTASANGVNIQGSPQSIAVKFIVAGYTLSGTAVACTSATSCTSSSPLGSATVTLTDANNKIVATTTTASGTYSFSGVATGSYTVSVSGGTDSNGKPYVGSTTATVSGDTTNVNIQALPT